MTDPLPWPIHPAADLFPMLDDDELRALADDIAAHGLHEPVWLYDDPERGPVLLDGRNRRAACDLAGKIMSAKDVRWYQGDDPIGFVISENVKRRHLMAGQLAVVADEADALADAEEAAAGARSAAAAESNRRRSAAAESPELAPVPTPEKPTPVHTRERFAAAAGISPRSAGQYKRVKEKAPELREKIKSGELSLKEAEKEVRLRDKAAKVAEIAATPVADLPADVTFPVILADPPWRYDYAEDTTRQIENHYPTMPLDDIAALEVPAADDAVLFMWATSPKLREAFTVLDGWGFTYRTCMVWAKDKIGMGYYARQQHELVLIATRGQLPVPDPADRPPSVFHGPRTEHSAKPVVLHELIERMYPQYRRVELFARAARPGWSVWGNQAQNEDVA